MKPKAGSLSTGVCKPKCIKIYPGKLPQNTARMRNQFCYVSDIRLPAFCKTWYITTHIPAPEIKIIY